MNNDNTTLATINGRLRKKDANQRQGYRQKRSLQQQQLSPWGWPWTHRPSLPIGLNQP